MYSIISISVIVAFFFSMSAGEHEIRGRIFNGKEAGMDQFKYMVVIAPVRKKFCGLKTTKFICGGTIISSNWVLTAAHCLDDVSKVYVFLGVRMAGDAEMVYKRQRNSIIVHPDFDPEKKLNDIALIQIPTTRACDRINFASLPFQSIEQVLTDKIGVTMGWGQPDDKSCTTDRLLWTETAIMSNDQCQKYSRYPTNKQLCGNTRRPYGSPCHGDSGGPLILKETDELVGIISYVKGHGCEAGRPVIFTRIASYLPWISEVTGIRS